MNDLATIIKNAGLSDKGARVYLAALELGEATVQDLARASRLKRTSLYYVIEELLSQNALYTAERHGKTRYLPCQPRELLRSLRERVEKFESNLQEIESRHNAKFRKPNIYFLYGPSGFKKAWDTFFESGDKKFSIITNGEGFTEFVSEKYIVDHIISEKKRLGIRSRQIVSDSTYARKIVTKDQAELRESRFMPLNNNLPFTEIIGSKMVIMISPGFYNTIFVVENDAFAETRQKIFDALWKSLPR